MPSDNHILIGDHTVILRPQTNELLVKSPDKKESVIWLSHEEFMLFRILNENRGLAVKREYLIKKIWSGEEKDEELLEKTTSGLITKLQDAGIHEDFIETAPGQPYRLLFNEDVDYAIGPLPSISTNIRRNILWALLIIILLLAIIFIADLALPDDEELPEAPAEMEIGE